MLSRAAPACPGHGALTGCARESASTQLALSKRAVLCAVCLLTRERAVLCAVCLLTRVTGVLCACGGAGGPLAGRPRRAVLAVRDVSAMPCHRAEWARSCARARESPRLEPASADGVRCLSRVALWSVDLLLRQLVQASPRLRQPTLARADDCAPANALPPASDAARAHRRAPATPNAWR